MAVTFCMRNKNDNQIYEDYCNAALKLPIEVKINTQLAVLLKSHLFANNFIFVADFIHQNEAEGVFSDRALHHAGRISVCT